MDINKIYCGDSLSVLKTFPDNSIDCCITSPPYWGLRAYGTNPVIWGGKFDCNHVWVEHVENPKGGKGSIHANVGANKVDDANRRDKPTVTNFCSICGAWRGELGNEPYFNMYIQNLCSIFYEIKRVLKPEGSCWVNLGDTYASNGGANKHKGYNDPKYPNGRSGNFSEPSSYSQQGALPKSLCQIPSRFAVAMCDNGWILRNEIIWHKPNAMPSSAQDRFTVDFEKVFFFTKQSNYFFNTLYEPLSDASIKDFNRRTSFRNKGSNNVYACPGEGRDRREFYRPDKGRIKRCVWQVNTKPLSVAHFATFPEKLIEPMILAGCPKERLVLDPFMGAGTTGLVAKKLGRNYVGIELNPEYIKIAEKRISEYNPNLVTVTKPVKKEKEVKGFQQMSLF